MNTRQVIAAAMLAAVAGGAPASAEDKADAAKDEREKCYGVARAGKNDCAAKDGSHACAGHAGKDGDPANWVYAPKGLCDKLAGGVKG